MQTIAIIGLGLIGGSIGLALRRWSADNNNALRVLGFDADMDKQTLARKIGAVDDTAWKLSDAVGNADIVVVATPVGAMKDVFEDITPLLKDGAIVTDTGSTKANVMEWSSVLPDHVSFIGGHPMAGKSESLEAATPDLFHGATWVLIPGIRANDAAIRNVLGIVTAVGAEAFFADATEHDSYVAAVSHLPMVAAAALVHTATSDQAWRDAKTLASTGFRDTTRLALGSPAMHRDISLTNKESIARWIDQLVVTLNDFKASLLDQDADEAARRVNAFFERAQDERAKAESVRPRSADMDMAPGHAEAMGSSMSRMFLGGFARKDKKSDKQKR